jgi:hypothetical protein
MDDLSRNLQIASSEQQIRMSCRAAEKLVNESKRKTGKDSPEWIANDEKRDVFRCCITQDLAALEFYHVTICKDELLAVESFLARM